jgi:hypothetical protein
MESELIKNLKNHLNSITKDDFKKEWKEIKDLNLGGELVEDFIKRQDIELNKKGLSVIKSTCPFKCGIVTIIECSWCGKSYKEGVLQK